MLDTQTCTRCVGGKDWDCGPGAYRSLGVACDGNSTADTQSCTLCPAGRYGAPGQVHTNATCSGLCEEGYWCFLGSSSGTANECGSSGFYCPAGSQQPRLVEPGYYSTGGISNSTRTDQNICEPGYFCQAGIRQSCPDGEYSSEYQSTKCFAPSPGEYVIVNVTTGGTFLQCEPGFYCKNGVKQACVSELGEYQDQPGLSYCNVAGRGYFASSAYNQTLCPGGTYSSTPPSNTCAPCENGEVAPIGSWFCTRCADLNLVPDYEQQVCVRPDEAPDTVLFIMLGTSVLIFGPLYLLNRCKYPQSRADVFLLMGLTLVDFLSDLLFIYSLTSAEGQLANLRIASVVFIILPLCLNAMVVFGSIQTFSAGNPQFLQWSKITISLLRAA